VVGVHDGDWGEVLVAFVQVKAGEDVDEKQLMEFCRSRLASFKVPRIWRFVSRFPQTASGKIRKFVLREALIRERLQ
jgi:fatty-acyl-CoA synthase